MKNCIKKGCTSPRGTKTRQLCDECYAALLNPPLRPSRNVIGLIPRVVLPPPLDTMYDFQYKLWEQRMIRTYRLTAWGWLSLFQSQGDQCGICGTTNTKYWCVDHDHECCQSGKSCGKCIRGILCGPCNTAFSVSGCGDKNKETHVYQLYDINNTLLYVGVTSQSLENRFYGHKHKDWWGDVVWLSVDSYADRKTAVDMEISTILHGRPLHNPALSPVRDNAPTGYYKTLKLKRE